MIGRHICLELYKPQALDYKSLKQYLKVLSSSFRPQEFIVYDQLRKGRAEDSYASGFVTGTSANIATDKRKSGLNHHLRNAASIYFNEEMCRWGKPERKKSLAGPRRRREYNIKMDLLNRLGGAYGTCVRRKKCMQGTGGEILGKETTWNTQAKMGG